MRGFRARLKGWLGSAEGASEPEDREFVRSAYKELLGREPDSAGAAHFLSALREGHNRTTVLMSLARSAEFREKVLRETAPAVAVAPTGDAIGPLGEDLVGRARYEAAWERLRAENPTDEYLTYHRERHWELFNAVAAFAGKPGARVLELGPTLFSRLYKELFPSLELVTLDRPASTGGVSAEEARALGASSHHEVDLVAERLSPSQLGTFDLVVCAEVVEHLLVEPVAFFSDLLGLVVPGGVLYVTTPNFLSHRNLEAMARGENPLAVFPGRGDNVDGHHHHREFAMNELVRFLTLAGGKVVSRYFSHCWDDPALVRGVLAEHPERKSGLVVAVRREP